MKKRFDDWIVGVKMKYAFRWIEARGLSVVRIVRIAGTNYIVGMDGAFYRIGKRRK